MLVGVQLQGFGQIPMFVVTSRNYDWLTTRAIALCRFHLSLRWRSEKLLQEIIPTLHIRQTLRTKCTLRLLAQLAVPKFQVIILSQLGIVLEP